MNECPKVAARSTAQPLGFDKSVKFMRFMRADALGDATVKLLPEHFKIVGLVIYPESWEITLQDKDHALSFRSN